jgi:heme-degrading monooxygenase HmoA
MILEVAILNIKPGTDSEYIQAFQEASPLIASIPGYISHSLKKCIETPSQYILLVHWNQLEDHTVGFRNSSAYQKWKSLLHHFYDPHPTVEHYEEIL